MKTRNLSIAALSVAVTATVILAWVSQHVAQATAGYRPGPSCQQLVSNGGFETDADWVIPPTGFPAEYSADTAHSGQWSMRLGIPPGHFDQYAWSSVYQEVTIPSAFSSAVLSFWYKPSSDDMSGRDRQGMILYDLYWNPLQTVLDVLSYSGTWTYKELDVSSYAGQTLRLYFYVSNNPYYLYGRTWMYVDDVSLECCGDVTPTPTPQLAFSPSHQTVFAHTAPFSFTAGVVITNVADLGAFEFNIVYNPDVVVVERIDLEDFLESTGRIAYTGYDDSLKLDGLYSFWAYTLPPPEDPGGPGPTGSGLLATAFLRPINEGETDLTFDNAFLSDTQGDEIPIAPQDLVQGHVVVTCGDYNGDDEVDEEDLLAMAEHWFCECGHACYDALYDVDRDCDIRVADIMEVASHLGPCPSGTTAPLQGAEIAHTGNSAVWIEPSEASVLVGDTLTVTVMISGALDLGAFQFDLHYDPDVLHVSQVAPGAFLGSTGRQVISPSARIDNEEGVASIDALSLPIAALPAGADGTGHLAHIALTAQNAGFSLLDLSNVLVYDIHANPGSVTAQDGGVTVLAEPAVGTFGPNGGSGSVGVWVEFATTYSDPNGYDDIMWAFFFLDREAPIGSGGLVAAYIQPRDLLWLKGGGVCRPGQEKWPNTDYITLDCLNSSVYGEGDTLTINWHVRPDRCFAGGCGWNCALEFVADSSGLQDAGLVGWWRLDPPTGLPRDTRWTTPPSGVDVQRLREEINGLMLSGLAE